MRTMTVALIAVGTLLLPLEATAHPAREFRACARLAPGDCLERGAAFVYGDTAVIRGRVAPPHSEFEAKVLRRDPDRSRWRVVDTVPVTRRGKMFHLWDTRRSDAVQDEPYLFRFRIRGHGLSNTTEAFILFGE